MTSLQIAIPSASEASFTRLAAPLRREIKAHCYRMLGALDDAEDLTQDTYLRAWRAFASFEGGSFRAWLYRIATNACLNALESRNSARRWLPEERGPAPMDSAPDLEIPWLEPYPDFELDDIADPAPHPEARYAAREAVRLAFVAAVQALPPRQRAALLLCDVLGFSAEEAAATLDATKASINSALQRSRETLTRRYGASSASTTSVGPAERGVVERYMRAWESHDIDAFVALLKQDAVVVMPPWPQWLVGRAAVAAFFSAAWATCGGLRLQRAAANNEPALAVYERDPQGRWNAHSLHVLSFEPGEIARLTMFTPPTAPRLFPAFGLAESYADDASLDRAIGPAVGGHGGAHL